MKKKNSFLLRLSIASVVVASSLASSAKADDSVLDLSVYANYWDVKDGDDNVWGPGLGISVPVAFDGQLKLDGRIAWFEDVGEDRAGDLSLYPLDLGVSWHHNCNQPWDLYAMAGASYVWSDADPAVSGKVDVDNTLGAYVGVGARYNFIDRLGFFTNVYYRFAELDIDANVPGFKDTYTYEADGLNVDLGLAYSF